MANPTTEPTTVLEKVDRCGDLPHRPRVLLGKMGLDGHDRGVKLIARALRDSGVHVIYSGLWQTPQSLAQAARDEDVDLVAASMMSNSHNVLVPRLLEACAAVGRPDMLVDIGGIIPQEDVQGMLDAGVHRVFHTGTSMQDLVDAVRDAVKPHEPLPTDDHHAVLGRAISMFCDGKPVDAPRRRPGTVIGLTGSPGAGKSTLVASLASTLHGRGQRLAVVAFDPMSPITSGALLGDRLRVDFNAVGDSCFYRSLAVVGEDYQHLPGILELLGGAGFDNVIVETVGAGQSDVAIRSHVDSTTVVMVPGMGDAVQMDKAGILEIADLFVVNKADFAGESKLVRELLDIAGGRDVLETIATRGQGVEALADRLFSGG
ncbi:MAG: cobalamin-dependent protein [Phycisphaerales bacterium]|nr:cobalamin-dependent protein [Phycisphaerales bacterium]